MYRYALLSNPNDSCNPTADSVNGAQDGGIIVIAIVTMVILMYCVMNGTTILNIFNPEVRQAGHSHCFASGSQQCIPVFHGT